MMSRWLVPFALVATCAASEAVDLEEVVVTGMRSSGYGEAPAVTITRTADFLVQNIRLVNDSRAPELRRQEILRSIESLMREARRNRNFELSHGRGYLLPIDLGDEALQLIDDEDRADTSHVDIYVKVRFDPARDAKEQIGVLRRFIEAAEKVGRTEIDLLGDIGLSLVSPERYRYEIIRAISAETRRLVEALGANCKATVTGLEGRVQWRRSDVAELTLYVPYQIQVGECAR